MLPSSDEMMGRTIITLAFGVANAVGCANTTTTELGPGGNDDSDVPTNERCSNGLDDDQNGRVDDGCACCTQGTQTCLETDVGPAWGDCSGAIVAEAETCDGADNDCNGTDDDLASGVPCEVAVDLAIRDCQTITCPSEQPYPVGCVDLNFFGSGSGCVGYDGGSSVNFKEGGKCDVGGQTGSVICSQIPGAGVDATTCPHNKPPNYQTSCF
jgi:hypothetical protein